MGASDALAVAPPTAIKATTAITLKPRMRHTPQQTWHRRAEGNLAVGNLQGGGQPGQQIELILLWTAGAC
jgi:hypothetical protein